MAQRKDYGTRPPTGKGYFGKALEPDNNNPPLTQLILYNKKFSKWLSETLRAEARHGRLL